MNVHLDCPGCGRLLRVNLQFAGRTVRCPSCGTAYVAPSRNETQAPALADDPASNDYVPCESCGTLVRTSEGAGPPRCRNCRDKPPTPDVYDLVNSAPSEAVFAPAAPSPAPVSITPADGPPPLPPPLPPAAEESRPPQAGGPPCPECGESMAGDAVVCLVCGFNRATGKRLKTVSRRLTSHWDSGNFPLLARLVVFVLLVAACCLPLLAFAPEPETQLARLLIPLGGAALGALTLGTFHRVIVTTDPQGTPILVQHPWVCFVPTPPQTTDLTEFRTIRLTHRAGSVSALGLLLMFGLCLLGGVLAILLRMHLLRADVFTLEIVSRRAVNGEPLLEPLMVYHGRSERMVRGIGDALEQIAGLRYG